MKKTFIVYALLVIGMLILAVVLAKSDLMFIADFPSFGIVLGPAVLMLLSHYRPKEFINAFKAAMEKNNADERELKNALLFFSTAQTLVVASAVVGVFLGIIMILGAIWKGYADSAKVISGWMAVDIISILYAAIIMIVITIPFKSALHKKLNELNG